MASCFGLIIVRNLVRMPLRSLGSRSWGRGFAFCLNGRTINVFLACFRGYWLCCCCCCWLSGPSGLLWLLWLFGGLVKNFREMKTSIFIECIAHNYKWSHGVPWKGSQSHRGRLLSSLWSSFGVLVACSLPLTTAYCLHSIFNFAFYNKCVPYHI